MEKWDVDYLDKLLKLLRSYKVSEISCNGYHIKMHENFDYSDEVKAKLDEIEKVSNVSDDEIMFNPYAGMEMEMSHE